MYRLAQRGCGTWGGRVVADRTAVIVLGYGAEPLLLDCLRSALRQLGGTQAELILVDNGIPAALRESASSLGVRILGDGQNTGFAGGCNLAADSTSAETLVFLNSDAVLRDGAVDVLVDALDDPGIGIVGGCLRLADRPDLINSVGNPLQFLGFTWAGHCGEPAEAHARPGRVPVATGGLFAVRRTTWEALGGFEPQYFAYHEDTDLSLRCWLSGREVHVAPSAVADHDYHFSRNPQKMYLVERNRFITVICDYPAPLLLRVLPAVVLLEAPLLAMAVLAGWGRQKIAAWLWVVRHRRWLAERRRHIQRQVVVAPTTIVELLSAEISPPMVSPPPGMRVLNALLRLYWRSVRSSLR